MCAWTDVLGLRWSWCIYATAAAEDDGVAEMVVVHVMMVTTMTS